MSIREERQLLAEMRLICRVVDELALPKSTPMGEIFDLLRKQPNLSDEQTIALALWDMKHSQAFLVEGQGLIFSAGGVQ